MSRWHKPTCREPNVHPRSSIAVCSTCGGSAVWNPAPGKAPGIPPLPKPPKDGIFNLWWPSSVSYADSTGNGDSSNVADSSAGVSVQGLNQTETRAVPAGSTPSPQAQPEAASASRCSPSRIGYAPLSKDHVKEIRLLRLFKGSLDDAIHGELVIAPLQDRMAFTALSYTWADEDGDSSRNSPIFLGRHWDMFAVTHNCDAALRRMRLLDRDLMVWVDAICIDQGNHVERNHQVGLMTEVYSCAEQVFVYLGDGRPEIASVLTKVRWPKERLSITLAAAQRFFSLAYFSRIWVVQEVANAKSVTVHYGSRSVDWTALQLVPSFANHLPGWIKAEYSKSKPSYQDFAQLLLDTSTSTHASDPRDSVFALFGLAKDCASQGLAADYTLTLPEVYVGAAAFAILELGDKRVLRHAVGQNADRIPTWVPAWGKIRRSPINESLRVSAKQLLLPDVTTAHPINCGCDMWGKVSISRRLGALKTFAATVLNLTKFNLHWLPWQSAQSLTTGRSFELDHTVVVRFNDADLRRTGRLILLHGSNTIFHVEGGESAGKRFQVIGCCDVFIWRPGPRWWVWVSEVVSARHGIPASATQVLQFVAGQLTSTKLKKMLEVEKEIRDYVQKHRPSLRLPQTALAPDSKVAVRGDVGFRLATPGAQFEVAIYPDLQPHLDFWESSQFWDLFGELQRQRLLEEEASSNQQHPDRYSRRRSDVNVYDLTELLNRWLFQAFAMWDKAIDVSTLRLERGYMQKLSTWAQEARHLERYLAIRLVCPPHTGALDLQVGKLRFPIVDLSNHRDHLPEIPGIWPNFEPWPGVSAAIPPDAEPQVPGGFDGFKRRIGVALEEAHATSVKAGLLDVGTTRLVVNEEYAREEAAREARKGQYEREMDDFKAVFSMCSFLRALVPQERVWEEIEIC